MSEPEIKSERWVQAIDDFSANCGRFEGLRKLSIRTYLATIVIFVNEIKGKSALALSRDLDVQYKTAFVLGHKIREAMGSEMKGAAIGGAGRVIEVDGCHVGGHVRPENAKRDRRDRRLAGNQTSARRVVVALPRARRPDPDDGFQDRSRLDRLHQIARRPCHDDQC